MTLRIILKNGSEFTTKCDNIETERNAYGTLVSVNWIGITENKPVFVDLSEITAIVRVMSDESKPDDSLNAC